MKKIIKFFIYFFRVVKVKNFFQILGVFALFAISLLYTEQAVMVVRDLDEIMIKIKEVKNKYEIKPIDAIITQDEIIPGLTGKQVDEDKSYHNMKRIGKFNPNLFEYYLVKPTISLENNYQKYIVSGNPKKNTISLVFIVKEETDVLNILEILKQKEISATFFVDGEWLEKNSKEANEIVKNGNLLGNLSNNGNYNDKTFTWIDTIIGQLANEQKHYCYMEEGNIDYLKTCAIYKNYTIKPSLVVSSSPLKEIKETIKPGSIISLSVDDLVLDELGSSINYLKAKGYKIVNLDEHLSEKFDS